MALFRKRHPSPAATSVSSRSDDPWARFEVLVAQDRSTWTDSARQLVAIGSLRTEVNNGGFHQYFFNSGGDLAMDALATATSLDLDSLASLIHRALDLLDGKYTPDRDLRQDVLESLDNMDAFEPLDDAFYALEESVDLDAAMSVLTRGA